MSKTLLAKTAAGSNSANKMKTIKITDAKSVENEL
ncbi:MAG: hypothetical protein QS98_C0001G0042 [archaeon GW2011_AR3]|nr:MAG: hypothetical protein QS98_C0001G0042 [archaeon GW2011_AR3]